MIYKTHTTFMLYLKKKRSVCNTTSKSNTKYYQMFIFSLHQHTNSLSLKNPSYILVLF